MQLFVRSSSSTQSFDKVQANLGGRGKGEEKRDGNWHLDCMNTFWQSELNMLLTLKKKIVVRMPFAYCRRDTHRASVNQDNLIATYLLCLKA